VPRTDRRILGGRYELGERIGSGGMGDVFAATDGESGDLVAVKLIRASLLSDRSARRRFASEASLAERVRHPNVVAVLDHGDDEGQPFLVMERLPGRTLRDRLAEGPMTSDGVRDLGIQVLGGLAAVHAVDVIHRDVKPGNVLEGNALGDAAAHGDGTVGGADARSGALARMTWKLADFGIAKWLGDELTLTATGELIGSAAYLSPERIAGDPASGSSDLYAVGVLLYEALCGRKPYAGDDPFQIASAIRAGSFSDPRELLPEADPGLSAAIVRGMARDPRDRFPDTNAFAEALVDRADMTLAAVPGVENNGVDETAALPPLDATTPMPIAPNAASPATDPASRTPLRDARRAHAPAGESLWSRLRRTAVGSAQRTLVTLAIVLVVLVAIAAFAAIASNDGPAKAETPRSAAPTATPRALPSSLEDALRQLEDAVNP
jgi:serine/threonine protein kinase